VAKNKKNLPSFPVTLLAKEKISTSSPLATFRIINKYPNGDIELTAEVPARLMETLEAIVAGKKLLLRPNEGRPVDLLARARMGEFEPLIRHFEAGRELTDKERRVLAAIARGALPRIGRPPETPTELRNRNIARFAAILKFRGGKRVADITAKKFNIDRSYVPKLVSKYKDEGAITYMLGSLLRALGADLETTWRIVLAYAGITQDDLREAAARKQRLK
jgi:hypothetical protein